MRDPTTKDCRAICTVPNWDLLKDPKEPLALDVEFQEYKAKDVEQWGHCMGRVAVVNTRGQTLYDVYVRYDCDKTVSTKMPPPAFGVTRKDLWLRNGAKESMEVEQNLKRLFHDRIIVGHGMRLDLIAVGDVGRQPLDVRYAAHIRPSQAKHPRIRVPNWQLQLHDPTEDARVTMLLYLRNNPYKGRLSFRDATPKCDDVEEFPPLGAAPAKKKR